MVPAQAPLPTDSSAPVQFEAGIHTSILMSESGEGFSVAAMRQNAGRFLYAFPPPLPPPCGGMNSPAATVCAKVIVVFFSASVWRLSQDAPANGGTVAKRV